MSYIEIEVDGVKYGWKYNQLAQHIFANNTDKSSEEMTLITSPYALFYAGLAANAYVKTKEAVVKKTVIKEIEGKNVEEDITLSYEDVCDLFDRLTVEQVQAITKAFQESIAFQDKLPKEEIKKKKVRKSTITDA